MESDCAGGRNSRNNSPGSAATIAAQSVGKHGFHLPQRSELQNYQPEGAGRRFAALSKDTSFEGECIPVVQSKLSRIRGNRNEGWELIPVIREGLCDQLCESNNHDTKR
jgi:hypothetical protein